MADVAPAASAPDPAATRAAGRRPGTVPLLVRQFRYQNLLFWRNPFSAFFTIAFPLMFLALGRLWDGGWLLAKPAGVLLLAYLAWILPSLHAAGERRRTTTARRHRNLAGGEPGGDGPPVPPARVPVPGARRRRGHR